MANNHKLPTKLGDCANIQPVRLGSEASITPIETGEAIAALQVEKMEQAYQERMALGTAMFAQSKITTLPVELGTTAAELKLDGVREAIAGFAWRWALVGGVATASCLLFGFGFSTAIAAAVLTVPVSCLLVIV